jgi:hypothetical protein
MGCCHFVSFLLSGKRFGVCNTHPSTFRLRLFAQRQRIALLAEAVVQRGQETREVVHLLRAAVEAAPWSQ